MRTSNNITPRANMGTHYPSKEHTSSRTNKDGKKYVIDYIPGREKNTWVREKTKVPDVMWTWVGHVSRIRDNRWTLCITTWKPYERKIY